jgi:gamma-glutamylcyclotransferase (GGCT)/AIG2-like uncharacterized protein YtfP
MLKLFVYGTLKRGFWNYDRFCSGVLDVEEAVVQGHLFEMPSGIPILRVPEEIILAHGSTDPLADTASQARYATRMVAPARLPENAPGAPPAPVYGELLTFDNPVRCLPSIDRLEGFQPGHTSLYRRVLVPVRTNRETLPAWLYVGDESSVRGFRQLSTGRWRS